jgi:signal transduction histidine kinase
MLFPLFLILWIGFELAHHGFAIHREANALTRELRRNVERQAAEISEAEMRIREQERLVAINVERQRLVRDMHDGAGGLLTRLLLRLRSGDVPLGEVREEIQATVDDLRQIIDSMDCADEGLDVALAIFRERVSPRLMHEGVTLSWSDEAARPLPHVAPPHMIQIYRILQEAVTNVLKHARASQVEMDLASEAEGRVRLSLSDNGVGFVQSAQGERSRWQRGLANMARRAQIIEAQLDVHSAPGQGTRITLTI